MDRDIQDNLEEYLHGLDDPAKAARFQEMLTKSGQATRQEAALMIEQARMIRGLRPPDDVSPSAGFYARLMERIEAERPRSIWALFLDPVFSKRLAFASVSLLVLLCVSLFTTSTETPQIAASAPAAPEVMLAEPEPVPVTSVGQTEGRDAMLIQLTSYQE